MDKNADPKDLLAAALQRLEDYGLTAQIERREVRLPKARADALVRIGYGDREATYAVELKRGLRPNGLGAVLHQLERLGEQGLLVADHVTPPMAEELRARKIPLVDAAGNAFLDHPPLFVWVKGERPKVAAGGAQPVGRAFQASGLQVLFALICHPEWVELPYREIAQRANVAHGTVGWVMAELPRLGFMTELRAKVTCPTLLLLGEIDRMTPPAAARDLATRITDARTVILPRAGHMMMVEQPDATIDALAELI